MSIVGILNGMLRVYGYGRFMPELRAHQLSSLTGILLFGVLIWLLNRQWPIASARQALTIGLTWLALTVAFEFLFGHYVAGHPWSRLLHDYNLGAGRVWALVLLWVAVVPFVIFRLTN